MHIQTFILKYICKCALGLFTFHGGKSSIAPCEMLQEPAQLFQTSAQHRCCGLILMTLGLALDAEPMNFRSTSSCAILLLVVFDNTPDYR